MLSTAVIDGALGAALVAGVLGWILGSTYQLRKISETRRWREAQKGCSTVDTPSHPPVLGDPESTLVETPKPIELKKVEVAKVLTLDERLNARYDFADVKTSATLKLLSWKNYAGKRMSVPFDPSRYDAFKRACTTIQDSLHDVKRANLPVYPK